MAVVLQPPREIPELLMMGGAPGAVVLTLEKLPRYRLNKRPGEPEGLPTSTALANATTPGWGTVHD